jgi:hypothetical protein
VGVFVVLVLVVAPAAAAVFEDAAHVPPSINVDIHCK